MDNPLNTSKPFIPERKPDRPQRRGFRFGGLPLAVRLITFFAGLVLLALAATTVYTALETRDTLTRQAEESFALRSERIAQTIDFYLEGDVETLQTIGANQTVLDALEARNASYEGTPEAITAQLEAEDARWTDAPDNSPLVQSVLSSDPAVNANAGLTDLLRDYVERVDENLEVFATDRYGGLVASTNRTSDYF